MWYRILGTIAIIAIIATGVILHGDTGSLGGFTSSVQPDAPAAAPTTSGFGGIKAD